MGRPWLASSSGSSDPSRSRSTVTGEGARRRLATVLRRLVEHHAREGEVDVAIPIARHLAEIDPWNERAHRQLMGLLVRAGSPAEALSHFSDLQDRLRHELGIAVVDLVLDAISDAQARERP